MIREYGGLSLASGSGFKADSARSIKVNTMLPKLPLESRKPADCDYFKVDFNAIKTDSLDSKMIRACTCLL